MIYESLLIRILDYKKFKSQRIFAIFSKKIRIEFESNYLSNASNEVTLKLLCIRHTLITNSLNIIFEELHNRRREKVLDPLKIM